MVSQKREKETNLRFLYLCACRNVTFIEASDCFHGLGFTFHMVCLGGGGSITNGCA